MKMTTIQALEEAIVTLEADLKSRRASAVELEGKLDEHRRKMLECEHRICNHKRAIECLKGGRPST